MIPMYFLQFDCVISTCEHWQIDFAGDALYLTGKKTGELTKVTAHVIICQRDSHSINRYRQPCEKRYL